jgi:hypothetical protein
LKKHLGAQAIPSPNLPLIDEKGNSTQVAPKTILARRVVLRNNEHVVQ